VSTPITPGLSVTPSQDQVYQAMEAFLAGVLPSNVPVIRGLPNRAAMPPTPPGFVAMQALFENRLRMAIDTFVTTGTAPPTTYSIEQGLELMMQVDCYGKHSGTWASIISTTFQDTYGCNALGPNCQPLYCNEARMIPLTNEELAYEERYSLDMRLQFNPVVTPPQQYTDALDLELVNVDVTYPS
jgi:hypothetical protein